MDGVDLVLPYSQRYNYLLEVAGIKDINNEEAQEYGLQCGSEEDGNIIGSTEYVLGGGGSGWIRREWE
jgi:hypothetical protein